MQENAPKITRSGVRVNAAGLWLAHGETIVNRGILEYFKRNLRRDGPEYYIVNRFGSLLEHGYLEAVEGFPLFAVDLETLSVVENGILLEFLLDSGERLVWDARRLVVYSDEMIGMATDANVPVRLSARAMLTLADFLLEDSEGFWELTFGGVRVCLAVGDFDIF